MTDPQRGEQASAVMAALRAGERKISIAA